MDNRFIKEQIRIWMQERVMRNEPPPELDEIRRAVGWVAVDTTRGAFPREQQYETEQRQVALA